MRDVETVWPLEWRGSVGPYADISQPIDLLDDRYYMLRQLSDGWYAVLSRYGLLNDKPLLSEERARDVCELDYLSWIYTWDLGLYKQVTASLFQSDADGI